MSVTSRGMAGLMAAEATAALAGFAALVVLARRLGPESLARVEFAAALAGVMLVWVRGGIESIALREAARRPRLIARWAGVLLAVKLVLALVAFAIVALTAVIAGEGRGATILAAGLVLFPSALVVDLGPRATGHLGAVAASQVARAVGLALATWWLVRGPGHETRAAGCAALAEMAAATVLGVVHLRRFGPPRPGRGVRAAVVLARRGAVASVSRIGRVFLFAADALALGVMAAPSAGPYLAARRVTFALAALGLVIPSALAPGIARAWLAGRPEARDAVAGATARMLALALPASLGLALTADGWTAFLFGPAYRDDGMALGVLACRMPLLLVAALHQAALIAVRREGVALRLVGVCCLVALAVVPIAAWRGPIAAGVAMIVVEGLLAAGGWFALRRLGIAPPLRHADLATLGGCAVMAATVLALRDRPAWVASVLGAGAYGSVAMLAWGGAGRPAGREVPAGEGAFAR